MLLIRLDSVELNTPDITFDVVLPSRFDTRYRFTEGHDGKIHLDIVISADDNVLERCEQLQQALAALPDCFVDITARLLRAAKATV